MDAIALSMYSMTGRPYYVYTGSFREDVSGDSNHVNTTTFFDVFLIREGNNYSSHVYVAI